MKIAVLMMFRDDADIIGESLEHWQRLGVDRFFLCNNLSADGSADIARKYCADIMTDDRTSFPQQQIVNQLKDRAIATGHNWIFPADADEFLVLPQGCNTLRDWLYQYPQQGHAVGEMPYLNIMPNGRCDWQRPQKKVFGKIHPSWSIVIGNHFVIGQKPTLDPMGAYYNHFPVRSYEQFKHKMEVFFTAFAQLPYRDNRHAIGHKIWQQQGERYIQKLWVEQTGLPVPNQHT
jgi:hypothetical protein